MENTNKEYTISCPYCFKEFEHDTVEFRSNFFYNDEMTAEFAIDNVPKSAREAFCLGQSEKYRKFWSVYGNTITESSEDAICSVSPYELPIISSDLIKEHVRDNDGLVVKAIDLYGHETDRRVCPYCNNPLPNGYGKKPVKRISIIGIAGAGKTVYISQLLKGMGVYANKCGLNAFFTSDHERKFIKANPVEKMKDLPQATAQMNLSQPMFYDIVQSDSTGNGHRVDTIVIYDIAGENCRDASAMEYFGQFIKKSDGLIVLIDPKQLGFVSTNEDEEVDDPNTALITLHNVIVTSMEKKCDVPVAVCLSKSDMYFDVLPSMASEDVQVANLGHNGLPTKEFNAREYNPLSEALTNLLKESAGDVCHTLYNDFIHYNFFSLCAIGCEVENGRPLYDPDPKRIEEPILWLFKQFGYIKSNDKVKLPFPREKVIEVTKIVRTGPFGICKKEVREESTVSVEYEEDIDS